MFNTLTVMLVSAVAAQSNGEFMSAEAKEAARFGDLSADEVETVTRDERFGAYDGGNDDFSVTSEELIEGGGNNRDRDTLSWFNEVSGMPFFESNK